MLRPFKLHEPTSVDDAISLLGRFGEEAKVYCGGTEFLLAMKEGLLRYSHLVNIKSIPGLDVVGYDQGSGMLSIGSTVTHTALEHSPQIQSHFPMVAEAEGNVANVRVRNVGTIGGNLCFSEPHSDPGGGLLKVPSAVVEMAPLDDGKTELSFNIEFTLLGKLGAMGYPLVKRKAGEMAQLFGENLRERLEQDEDS